MDDENSFIFVVASAEEMETKNDKQTDIFKPVFKNFEKLVNKIYENIEHLSGWLRSRPCIYCGF